MDKLSAYFALALPAILTATIETALWGTSPLHVLVIVASIGCGLQATVLYAYKYIETGGGL